MVALVGGISFFFLPGHTSLCYVNSDMQLMTGHIMTTKTGKKRQRQYVRKQKRQGKHNLNIFVTNEAYQILRQYQEQTGMIYGDIVDQALKAFGSSDNMPGKEKADMPEPRPEPERPDSDVYDSVLSGLKARLSQGESYNEILPDLCLLLEDMKKDGMPYKKMADRLNQAGILTRTHKKWNFNSITSTYYRCQKR
jgi:hypothetical protein